MTAVAVPFNLHRLGRHLPCQLYAQRSSPRTASEFAVATHKRIVLTASNQNVDVQCSKMEEGQLTGVRGLQNNLDVRRRGPKVASTR